MVSTTDVRFAGAIGLATAASPTLPLARRGRFAGNLPDGRPLPSLPLPLACPAAPNLPLVLARTIFEKDEVLDRFNLAANKQIAEVIKKDIDLTTEAMFVLSIIRKLERVGDQCTNIAEEIIFYIEAKVLKHLQQKQ